MSSESVTMKILALTFACIACLELHNIRRALWEIAIKIQ